MFVIFGRPSIRFSSDEDVACRMVTNEIQFFDVGDLSKGFVSRLRVPGIAAFELSNFPASFVAAFVPESKVPFFFSFFTSVCFVFVAIKVFFFNWFFFCYTGCNERIIVQGVPASVQIFKCGQDSENQQQPVARKSFFRASSVQLKWNRGSTGLLVVVQSDVDKTNQSYYGESKLNYLTTDGSYEGLVPLSTSFLFSFGSCNCSWNPFTYKFDFCRQRRSCPWCSLVMLGLAIRCCLRLYPFT